MSGTPQLGSESTKNLTEDEMKEFFEIKLGLARKDIVVLIEGGFGTGPGFMKLTKQDIDEMNLTRPAKRILQNYSSRLPIRFQSAEKSKSEATKPIECAHEKLDTALGIDDIQSVLEKLYQVKAKWFKLGLALDVKYAKLTLIEKENKDDKASLRETLTHRLQTDPPLIWRDLCKALRSSTVGRDDVADTIQRNILHVPEGPWYETEPEKKADSLLIAKQGKDKPGTSTPQEATVFITNKHQLFVWDRFGLNIRVPENSLPPGVEKCVLHVTTRLSSPLKAPDDHVLVSEVYRFQCEPKVNFQRNLTIEMQHSASTRGEVLVFARAGSGELKFEILAECGSFPVDKCFGYCQVKQFSWFAIFQRFRELIGIKERQRRYCVLLLYKILSHRQLDISLLVCEDLRGIVMETEKGFIEDGFIKASIRGNIIFESDHSKIQLKVEEPEAEQKHWQITPVSGSLELEKDTIDRWSDSLRSSEPCGVPPVIQLKAMYDQKQKVTGDFSRKLTLSGVQGDNNSLQVMVGSEQMTGAFGCQPRVDYSLTDCSNGYNTMVKCAVKLSNAMSRDPLNLATELLQGRFISETTLLKTQQLNETSQNKGNRLYTVVLETVKNFPLRFSDFIDILRHNIPLYHDVLAEIDRLYTQV